MVRVIQYGVVVCFICIFFCSCRNTEKEIVFSVDSQELTQFFNTEGGEITICITCNKDLHSIVADSSWCKSEIWTNKEEKRLILTVSNNRRSTIRNTEITLVSGNKELAQIKVAQLGTGAGILAKTDTVYISDELNFTVNVVSNFPIEFNLPEWIIPGELPKKSNSVRYFFHAHKLPEEQLSREGKIIIVGEDNANEGQRVEIPVIQTESLPRFIVISDITIGRADSEEKLLKKLSNLLHTPKSIDAVFIVGDLTGRGAPGQYEDLKKICDSIVSPDIPIHFMMGNTDHFLQKAETIFANEIQQPHHQYFTIKGYPFVTLSMTGIYTEYFTQEDKNFLLESFENAQELYPGKPIFFFTHIGTSDTYYGTEKELSNLGSEVLFPILSQFPNLIAFSGHTNFPLGDPRSIHQGVFTSVNIGSGIHSQIEYGYTEGMYPPNYQNVSEGLIVSVLKDGNVEIERWDVFRNEEILPKWTVEAPHDGSNFTYANRTGGAAPSFSQEDKAVIRMQEDGDFAVTFPAAYDDERVHHYLIEVLNEQKVIFQNTRFSQFYLNSEAPEDFTVKLLSLPENVPLRAEIRAIDSYNNISEPLISETFTAKPFIPRGDIPVPVADLFDIQFEENGMAKDISVNKIPVSSGETTPVTYYSEEYKRYVAQFENIRTSFYKIDYTHNQSIQDALLHGFALETIYMSNDLRNSAPLSGKEWEGLGIEQEVGGQIEFWVYLDDKYKKAKSSVFIETGKYYHVVAIYDQQKAKMSIYINGKKAGEREAPGKLFMPHRLDSRWFCIGGDTHPTGLSQHTLNGDVVVARMYSKPLSADEVYILYQNSKNSH